MAIYFTSTRSRDIPHLARRHVEVKETTTNNMYGIQCAKVILEVLIQTGASLSGDGDIIGLYLVFNLHINCVFRTSRQDTRRRCVHRLSIIAYFNLGCFKGALSFCLSYCVMFLYVHFLQNK